MYDTPTGDCHANPTGQLLKWILVRPHQDILADSLLSHSLAKPQKRITLSSLNHCNNPHISFALCTRHSLSGSLALNLVLVSLALNNLQKRIFYKTVLRLVRVVLCAGLRMIAVGGESEMSPTVVDKIRNKKTSFSKTSTQLYCAASGR